MSQALFLAFGTLMLLSSLLVILSKNPVSSALFLVLSFCSLAGLYLVLHAEFLGMVQIIVYAGAIMVLFLFVIMYLNLGRDVEGGVSTAFRRVIGWLTGAALLALGATVLGRGWFLGPSSDTPPLPGVGNTQALGQLLYTRYLFPFEITSIVLLVAMVGAVMIARGRQAPGSEKYGRRLPRIAIPASPEPARHDTPAVLAAEPPVTTEPEPVGVGPGAGGGA